MIFQNKKNKLKSRYIDDCKRCKRWSDGNIRMLKFVNLKTYQNLTFTISKNINTTFYYFQRSDCAGLKRWFSTRQKWMLLFSFERASF